MSDTFDYITREVSPEKEYQWSNRYGCRVIYYHLSPEGYRAKFGKADFGSEAEAIASQERWEVE